MDVNYKIISRLKEQDGKLYNKFIALVDGYEDELNNGALIRLTGFTPHNADIHCKNIYRILSDILPEQFYRKYSFGDNIFVLCVGAFLHDLAMAHSVSIETRCKHSEIAKKMVHDEIYTDRKTVMKSNIKREYADAVMDIIYSHSDIKDEYGNIKNRTLEETIEKYDTNGLSKGEHEELNVPFLAAVLRLADELDLDYSRIEDTGYERKDNTEESKMHYERCEYFKRVRINSNNTGQLILEEDTNATIYFDEEKKQTVAVQILSVYQKVCDEFDRMKNRVLFNTKYASDGIWNIRSIELKDKEKYTELIKKKEN